MAEDFNMKTLITLLASCLCLNAAQVNLAWDSPASTNGLKGYYIYAHTNSLATGTNLASALVRVKVPGATSTNATVQFTNSATWFFVATAYGDFDMESVPSNEVIATIPKAFPQPANVRTVAVEYIPTITGTNWTDVGFFRFRITP
jgi:hypothetical protein